MSADLTQGAIGKWLYKLTAPMVVGILAIFLFNLVDTYFIGLLGTKPLAAVSFTFPVTMLIMNLAIGLSIATGAITARSLGQKNQEQARVWVTASLYLALVIGLVMGCLGLIFQSSIFRLLGADDALLPTIAEYMNWWLGGCVVLIILVVVNASIRATGNTKLPSYMMMASAVLNGIFDPLLIFGIGPFPELGIQGAAIATVLSWSVAFIGLFRYLLKRDLICLSIPPALLDHWRQLIKLGLPASLTNMLGPLANGIIVAWVADYGVHAVAAYGVGSRIEPLALIVVMAFTASLPPFVGQNHGAGSESRIESALIKSMQFVFIWQLLVYALLSVMAVPISSLFSDEPKVQHIIQTFIYIVPLSYFAVGFVLVSTATINALHKTHWSLNINLVRLCVLYIPCAWIGHTLAGLDGLFWGCAIGNLLMGGIILLLFRRMRRHPSMRQRLLSA
ncbi:MAG: MATE family efflux transporter [Gammaproteobacteria bacterium]|nr:MATE family efflux transporter [Gammaproteobacteria bacterium]